MRPLVVVLALSLGGCSWLQAQDLDSLPEKVDAAVTGNFAAGVTGWCSKLPKGLRADIIGHVNSRPEMAGNSIAVNCVGD